jgi:hypothetical protein
MNKPWNLREFGCKPAESYLLPQTHKPKRVPEGPGRVTSEVIELRAHQGVKGASPRSKYHLLNLTTQEVPLVFIIVMHDTALPKS